MLCQAAPAHQTRLSAHVGRLFQKGFPAHRWRQGAHAAHSHLEPEVRASDQQGKAPGADRPASVLRDWARVPIPTHAWIKKLFLGKNLPDVSKGSGNARMQMCTNSPRTRGASSSIWNPPPSTGLSAMVCREGSWTCRMAGLPAPREPRGAWATPASAALGEGLVKCCVDSDASLQVAGRSRFPSWKGP